MKNTDEFGILTNATQDTEVRERTNAGKVTLLIMLFGVLPLLSCIGLYATSVFLPESQVGFWLNDKKKRLKNCKPKSSDRNKKKKIQMREPASYPDQDSKEDAEVDEKKKQNVNKIYPSMP